MRYMIADYLVFKDEDGEDVTALLGTGVTSLNESPSPKVNSDAYIHQRNASPTVTGYENSFPYDAHMIQEEAALMALYRVGRDQLVGEDAEFDYIRVDLYDTGGAANTFPARKFHVACEPGDTNGDPTDIATTSGTLHQMGDLIQGTFNTSTKTFTAAA